MQTMHKSIEPSSGPLAAETELLCVDPDLVEMVWPRVAHFVKRALERSRSDYTPDYIFRKLMLGESLLWVIRRDHDILAAGTTEICGVLDTKQRVCVITSLGGRDMHLFRHLVTRIYQYARDEKCELVRLYGRPGWARELRDDGWQQPWIALEKRL